MKQIIEIKDLTYTYPGSGNPTLEHVSLTVEKGDFLAIVGNNGCGKSTLCKAINGLIPHFITGEYEGTILVGGKDTLQSDIGELAQVVGYVYQDFENQIVRPTVLDDASYACMNYAMEDYQERGRTALRQCGLVDKEDDYIWQLSGGQMHLLVLAGAVSLKPDVLILDEPIAQLDPKHADQVYEVLKELNEKYGKTIIVIEHHTEYIADYCKHVLLLKDGRVEWKLPVKEALNRVEELQACNIFPPQITLAAYRIKSNLRDTSYKLPITVKDGAQYFADFIEEKHLLRMEKSGEQIMTERNKTAQNVENKENIVSYQQVSLSYRSVKGEAYKVFENFSLDIHRGEKIAIIGSNGAGKSTFMKLMTGILKPTSGDICIKEQSVKRTKTEKLAKYVSLVYQNPEDMFIKDNIASDIAFAMKAHGKKDWKEQTDELLERFRLTDIKDRDGRLLSGGQMRRASLAIGVAMQPEVLLLDEPTANLDIATRKEIMRTLNDMKDITETVLIATHDMQLVSEWATRIIVLQQGKIIADGSRDEVFGNQTVVEQAGIRPPEIFTMGKRLHPKAYCYTVDEFVNTFGIEGA